MKPRKAKEILDINIKDAGKQMPDDCRTALIIGSDAIGRILIMRSYNIAQALLPLKGETATNGQNLPAETLRKLRESPLGGKPQA